MMKLRECQPTGIEDKDRGSKSPTESATVFLHALSSPG
jgi:hypothetical protein